MIARTVYPDVFHTTYNEWAQFISHECAAYRALDQLERHLHLCNLAALAREIQRK